jgi:hypothetical protein
VPHAWAIEIAELGRTGLGTRNINRPPGLRRTTRDNGNQLPHPATNHDHGLIGPGRNRRTQAKITVRTFVSSKCRNHPHRRAECIDDRHRRQGGPSHQDPIIQAMNARLSQGLRKRNRFRCKAQRPSSASRPRRSSGVAGATCTHVRSKICFTSPQMHQCRKIQKASYAGLLLSRADRI